MKYYAFLCLSVPLALASYQDPSKTIPLKSTRKFKILIVLVRIK
jgi:hypothetical protein